MPGGGGAGWGGSATSTTSASTSGPDSSSTRTAANQLGMVMVTNDNGLLLMDADGDINLSGAQVRSNGSASLTAGGDINVAALALDFENQVGVDPKNHGIYRETVNLQSDISITGNLDMAAGQDLNVVGSQVAAGAVLNMLAGGDLSVVEARDSTYSEGFLNYSVKHVLNTKSTTVESQSSTDTAVSSSISGGTVNLTAGSDLNLRGSAVAAESNLSVQAGGDINIAAAENYSQSDYSRVDKKSGIWGAFDLTSLNIKAGKLEEGKEKQAQTVTNTASALVSKLGGVDLYAGRDVNIKGSAISAQSGDLNISGENVTIENVFNLLDEKSREYSKFKGLTLQGGPTGVMKTLMEKSMGLPSKITNLLSKKDQELLDLGQNIVKVGQDAYDIYKDGKAVMDAVAKNDVRSVVGVSAELSYGSSSSEATSEKHQSKVVGSELSADRNMSITARGDSAGEGGDLNIVGSRVEAEGLVKLAANRDLNLLSAEEKMAYDRDMKSESSSGGIKFNFGAKGWGFSVTGKYNKTTEDSDRNYVKHIETVVSGGEGVNFASGNDTTLRGAVVKGDAIAGNVGGDLSIISEQDQDEAHQKNKSISAGIEIPVYGNNANFSVSFSKGDQEANSTYSSVNEQSGLFAGQGGFDLTVGGNTGLVGAVIASEAEAAKNRLTTGTLTVADLQNKSHYEGESSAWGLGVTSGDILGETEKGPDGKPIEKPSGPEFGYDPAKYNPGLTASFPMSDEGGDSSSTRSAIAQGSLTINDSAGQKERTGLSSAEFIAALNRDVDNAHDGPLADNPDLQGLLADQKKRAEQIKSYIKHLQTGVKYLNDKILNKEYADAKKAHDQLKGAIPKEKDPAKKAAMQAEFAALKIIVDDPEKKADYEKWMPGGDYRTAIQVVGTLAAVQYGGGDTLDAFMGMAVGYLASQSPTLQEFAEHIAEQSSTNRAVQNHTYDQIMEAFSLLGASVGGNSGQAAFQEGKPDQIIQKQLQEQRKQYEREQKEREAQQVTLAK